MTNTTNKHLKPEQIISTMHPVFAQRSSYRAASSHQYLWDILDHVFDPELPGLTIWDLGVLQDIQVTETKDNHGHSRLELITVVITLTYSGCPAVDAMTQDIIQALNTAGFERVKVKVALSPAWNTDMISPAGKQQLRAMNIAPPNEDDHPDCPVCGSSNTEVLSQFGSTSCKSMHRCLHCAEVFDYFKSL
ncbi:MAG: phenylacetate-CoA oxygenase subunit PaaJ [Alteromonadaceae bacterium]|nr:phenylacetate-CoA oxygenase subunit PaaJ [Alteromonadaceae bacterium]